MARAAGTAEPRNPTPAAHGIEAAPEKPAEAERGSKVPSLYDVQDQLCPNCHSGVLLVTRYDPEALHEVGQGIDPSASSGGAYDVRCFQCEYTDSRPLRPGPKFGGVR